MDGFRLDGRKVALIGGDRRNDYLGQRLAELGAQVWLARRRAPRAPGLRQATSLADALLGAGILICPMPPFGPLGRVWSDDPEDAFAIDGRGFALLERPSLVFAGSFPPALALEAGRAGCELISLGEMEEMSILNSIPTAEGAILMALERTTVTLHGSRAVVLGYGRTGQTLANALTGLGARVTVVARRPESRARPSPPAARLRTSATWPRPPRANASFSTPCRQWSSSATRSRASTRARWSWISPPGRGAPISRPPGHWG